MNNYNPYAAKIYIDGSAKPTNPGPAGLAGIIEYPEDLNKGSETIFEESYQISTINRMELLACIRAIEYIIKNKTITNIFIIYTDSEYVVNNQNRVSCWRNNKWIGSDDISIKNKDLWKEFLKNRHKASVRIEIFWIQNKSTELVKQVDRLAKNATKKSIRKKDYGFMPGKVGTSRAVYKGVADLYPACGETIILHVYKKEPDSKKENIIKFDLFDVDKQDFLYRYKVFVDKKYASKLNRRHLYKVTLNDNKKHPKITIFKEIVV